MPIVVNIACSGVGVVAGEYAHDPNTSEQVDDGLLFFALVVQTQTRLQQPAAGYQQLMHCIELALEQ